ncbi:hypothetical protein PAPYR_5539 [Paratrimastix pyriformis]|uniref:Ribonuclease H1 N-terminal domain-containing protein n=1 Tax=Paratrimastix pyriformis TaxID=342808 RepID=A0ABQ8UH53_9EUKA|nr:hypothetical protein PAPYR_5539 [Paratrimastix pyriformis]
MPKKAGGFYAVANGRHPGVYRSWDKARTEVEGFSQCCHQRFDTRAEARKFIAERAASVSANQREERARARVERAESVLENRRAELARAEAERSQWTATSRDEEPDSPPPRRYYAVTAGRHPGVYDSWAKASAELGGGRSLVQSFSSREEARSWMGPDYRDGRGGDRGFDGGESDGGYNRGYGGSGYNRGSGGGGYNRGYGGGRYSRSYGDGGYGGGGYKRGYGRGGVDGGAGEYGDDS